MALPVNGSTHLIPALLLIYRPRKYERLSWPSWLTYSGWLTHISGHPSAAGRAQDRESSPARDRRSTTVLRHQLHVIHVMLWNSDACLVCRCEHLTPSTLCLVLSWKRIMDVSFPCTFVPGNETTTQYTFVPGNKRVDVSFPEWNCLITLNFRALERTECRKE